MALKGFIIKFWDFYIYFYTFLYFFFLNVILYTFIVIQSGTPVQVGGLVRLFFSFLFWERGAFINNYAFFFMNY